MTNKNERPLRYVLYARKSTDSEDRQVASIESQINEMTKRAKDLNLSIIKTMQESSSGFHIGRKVFKEMIEMINAKKVDGIITWKLSRLSRNPDDAGRIMGMLQRGEIKNIRTSDRSWSPEDNVMMMYIEFGITNQFSRDLSIDTKRGLKQKAERGWSPNARLPIGYKHNVYQSLEEDEIVPDGENFNIVQSCLKSIATRRLTPVEAYTELHRKGFRTSRGKKLAKSTYYRNIKNKFYYGVFEYPQGNSDWYVGKHKPMITEEEHNQILEVLGGSIKQRPKRHEFAYNGGLIKCPECGCSIIADPKVKECINGNIHNYTYYRCSKKRGKCSQKALEVKELEKQLMDTVSSVSIPQEFHQWAIEQLGKDTQKDNANHTEAINKNRDQLSKCENRIDRLVDSWLNQHVPQNVYEIKLSQLEKEKKKLSGLILEQVPPETKLDKIEEVFSFAETVQDKFETGDKRTKRNIVMYLGSNLTLHNQMLSMEIQKPLKVLSEVSEEIRETVHRFEPVELSENKEGLLDYWNTCTEWGG